MIDWPKVVQDLEDDIASRKQNMRHAQTYIKELESEIEAMKQDIEQFQMALREQVELNKNIGDYQQGFEAGKKFAELNSEDVPNIAYLNGVAEGKKHQDALVAAAYSAAAEAVNEVMPHNKYEDQSYEYVAAVKKLTPADAEKALREFGMEVAHATAADEDFKRTFEQIVNEVMEKNT